MIYGCSGCKFRSTALEEVKAHHAVAHKTDRGSRSRSKQPAKPLEVILIDSDDDDDDDDESGSESEEGDSVGEESDDEKIISSEEEDTEEATNKAAKGADSSFRCTHV